MDLSKINAGCNYRETRKLSDLTAGTKYRLTDIRKVDTRFGGRIVVEIAEAYTVFLPPQVFTYLNTNSDDYNELYNNLRDGKIDLLYKGKNLVEFSNVVLK